MCVLACALALCCCTVSVPGVPPALQHVPCTLCVWLQVLAQKDVLSQRLCVLQLAHTEVELAAKTGLDDLADQDSLGTEGAQQAAVSTSEGGLTARRYSTSGSARSVMSAGGGEAGAARAVLERVRKLAAEALTAATADKRGHSLELENRRSGS